MKRPEKGWKTPNAWLLWKMQSWTLEQIKTAFQIVVRDVPGRVIAKVWRSSMHEDGYYTWVGVPTECRESE